MPKSESVIKTLRYLATNSPANMYEIRTDGDAGASKTVIDLIEDMQRSGLIKVWERKRYKQGKGTSLYYGLTQKGILEAISNLQNIKSDEALTANQNIIKKMRDNTRYHNSLPELFEFWSIMSDIGLEKEAIQRLRLFCSSYLHHFEDQPNSSAELPDRSAFQIMEGLPHGEILNKAFPLLLNPLAYSTNERRKLFTSIKSGRIPNQEKIHQSILDLMHYYSNAMREALQLLTSTEYAIAEKTRIVSPEIARMLDILRSEISELHKTLAMEKASESKSE